MSLLTLRSLHGRHVDFIDVNVLRDIDVQDAFPSIVKILPLFETVLC
jgi:hypothetical protein